MSNTPPLGRRDISARQWERLEVLLAPALELSPEARQRFLDVECVGDAVLRAELESLLAVHERTGPLDREIVRFTAGAADQSRGTPAVGSVVSHYEIEDRLGSGGMGVVYRARDRRLDRAVALKFLPPRLSGDARAKKRFLTEARAAAALQHANVCTVHEIGETAQDQFYIAMAFVEGHSLRDLIGRGPLPLEQALDIARQIARGLDCAHQHGIVHRDVKPANVMVGTDGVVRLVDFGVAKLADSTLTNPGFTPGTAAYMAPEQARGEDVDHRADLWALGAVLYEMLTGRRAFPGETDAVVLHAIIELTPPAVRTLRPEIPAELEAVVSRALAKSREQRFQSARAFHDALRPVNDDEPLRLGGVSEVRATALHSARSLADRTRPVSRSRFAVLPTHFWIGVAAVLVIAVGASYVRFAPSTPAPAEVIRVSISASSTVTPKLSATISPNGRQVAFVATSIDRGAMLWVRDLSRMEARALPGTDGAAYPFWSPDGRSLGFVADNAIKRLDLATGLVQVVVDSALTWGPAWGPDGTILFSRRLDEIAAVPATGGRVTTVAKADSAKGQTLLVWPRFLPDGRHFIYFARGRQPEYWGVYAASLDSRETKFLLRNDFRAWYAAPGYLVFARDETLVAQPFDAERLELHGEPKVIASDVWIARPGGHACFSVSETGALAYINANMWDGELAWFDRTGRPLGSAGPPVRYEGMTPQVSPDGQWVTVGRGEVGRESMWLVGASGEGATRLSLGSRFSGPRLALWSGDSRRVMYSTDGRLLVTDVASGVEQVVMESVSGLLQDWSADERFVLVQRIANRSDLWAARLDGDKTFFPLTQTPYNETQAQLSPNGKWIAYTANETGHDEVYVQPFPGPGQKRQVSVAGGAMPRWRRDGKELFYVTPNQVMTAVPVIDPVSLALGRPTSLFRTRLAVYGAEAVSLPTTYDVASDGQRFLLRHPPADPGPPITVVLNWPGALGR